MKKILSLGFAALLLSACSSVNTEKIRQLKEVAVVGINLNKRIAPPDGGALSLITAIEKDEDMKLEPILEKTANRIRRFESALPFRYMNEADLFADPDYRKWRDDQKEVGYYITAENYANIDPREDKELMKTFKFLPKNVGGVMAADMTFAMVTTGGFGPLAIYKVQATLTMSVYDRSGEEVLKIRRASMSDKSVKGAFGSFKTKDLVTMAEQASEAVLKDTETYINKKLRKK